MWGGISSSRACGAELLADSSPRDPPPPFKGHPRFRLSAFFANLLLECKSGISTLHARDDCLALTDCWGARVCEHTRARTLRSQSSFESALFRQTAIISERVT